MPDSGKHFPGTPPSHAPRASTHKKTQQSPMLRAPVVDPASMDDTDYERARAARIAANAARLAALGLSDLVEAAKPKVAAGPAAPRPPRRPRPPSSPPVRVHTHSLPPQPQLATARVRTPTARVRARAPKRPLHSRYYTPCAPPRAGRG